MRLLLLIVTVALATANVDKVLKPSAPPTLGSKALSAAKAAAQGVAAAKPAPVNDRRDEGEGPGLAAIIATLAKSGVVVVRKQINQNEFAKPFKGKPACQAGGKNGFCVTGQVCTDEAGLIRSSSTCANKAVCCVPPTTEVVWDETKQAGKPTQAPSKTSGGGAAGAPPPGATPPPPTATPATVTTDTNRSYTAPAASQVLQVPFAPATAVYWPLNATAMNISRNYSVICYNGATAQTQYPPAPVAGETDSCTHSGGKNCYACRTRIFMAMRSATRYHSGIDLYAPKGTPVIAAESGKVVNAYSFFENVCCVIVQNDSGTVINYGEIDCNYSVKINDTVTAGQKIGEVGKLKCCHPMMHFEMYVNGTTQNHRSVKGGISAALLNPTEYLLNAFENGK